MEYVVSAVSCLALNAEKSFKIVEKYGEKLSSFDTKIKWDGKETPIKDFKIPELDEYEKYSPKRAIVKVELKTGEHYRDFIGTFGNCIFSSKSVEIYDDYRE